MNFRPGGCMPPARVFLPIVNALALTPGAVECVNILYFALTSRNRGGKGQVQDTLTLPFWSPLCMCAARTYSTLAIQNCRRDSYI
eukprot:497179-Pelagomonas_calceolata.AAC.5